MKPCKNGHVDRYPNGKCRACAIARATSWNTNNPERRAAIVEKRRPLIAEASREKYLADRERRIAKSVERNRQNRAAHVAATRKWRRKNPAVAAQYNVRYRAAVQRATPPWADQQAISAIYHHAQCLNRQTGIRHSVDHVIPLAGKKVCGLHVAENLAVIPLAENCRKGNRYEP